MKNQRGIMQTIYLTGKEPLIRELAVKAFPAYNGRKFKIRCQERVTLSGTYWDGGSRNSYVLLQLSTGKTLTVPQYDPPQFGGPSSPPVVDLKEDIVCVQHSIFCGKDSGLTFIVHPDNMNRLQLPVSAELSKEEKIVLGATQGLKASYAGISNYRFHDAKENYGITIEKWNETVESLITKGFLRKNKSISPEGRNALGSSGFKYRGY